MSSSLSILAFAIVSSSLSWLFGLFSFSYAWILLFTGVTFVLWYQGFDDPSRTSNDLKKHTWFYHLQTETWLNAMLQTWWCFATPSLASVLQKRLNKMVPHIQAKYFDALQIEDLRLGDKAPSIDHVHTASSDIDVHTGLSQMPLHDIVLEANVTFKPSGFKMDLNCHLLNKWLTSLKLCVKDLSISGRIRMVLHLTKESPFPHVSSVAISFLEKPEIWFSMDLLNVVPIPEVPFLKFYVHQIIMDALATMIVQPHQLHVPIGGIGPSYLPASETSEIPAQGVLTVCIRGCLYNFKNIEDCEECTIQLGNQEEKFALNYDLEQWQGTCSFLVTDLKSQILTLNTTVRKILPKYSLASMEIRLSDYPWDRQKMFLVSSF